MERTGHRSLEGVRSYKRTSDDQREALSDIMNCPGPSKILRREDLPPTTEASTTEKSFTLADSLQLSHTHFSGCTVNFYVGQR